MEIKKRILPALVHLPANVQAQLISALGHMLSYDFPATWESFMNDLMPMLQSSDPGTIEVALLAHQELVKLYQWKMDDERLPLNMIIKSTFPFCDQIASHLIAADPQHLEAARILKIIFKSFYKCIQFDLPPALQEEAFITKWVGLMIQMVEKPIPSSLLPTDKADARTNFWWKAKKWAMSCLYRLFSRYGNTLSESFKDKKYTAFAKKFMEAFAAPFMKTFFSQLEKSLKKELVFPDKLIHLTLQFLADCIKHKTTWALLKPHVEIIIQQLVFPLMCFTQEDQELWEEEPSEYIQKKLDPVEDYTSPAAAAAGFLLTLVRERNKQMFTMLLTFINQILTSHQTPGYQRDGALNMLSTIASSLLSKKSAVKSQMGTVLVQFVKPLMDAQEPYLRARACMVFSDFCDSDQNDELLLPCSNEKYQQQLPPKTAGWVEVFEKVLFLMRPEEQIPVRVYAALTLERLVEKPGMRDVMATQIALLMQSLLQLMHTIDLEILTAVMERLVEIFPAEVTPFSVQLSQQLVHSFLKIYDEVESNQVNKQPNDDDEFAGGWLDDENAEKGMTAMGILKTLGTLIFSIQDPAKNQQQSPSKKKEIQAPTEHSAQALALLAQLEELVMPCIVRVLQNNNIDLADHVFEIVDYAQFQQEKISDNMWRLFELIILYLSNNGLDYIEETYPVLENYITFGSKVIESNQAIQQKYVELMHQLLSCDLSDHERLYAFKLMETLLLNCRKPSIDNLLPHFFEICFQNMIQFQQSQPSTGFFVHCMDAVLDCFYYHPEAAIQCFRPENPLLTPTALSHFLDQWLAACSKMNRVHDHQLSIFASLSLIKYKASNQFATPSDVVIEQKLALLMQIILAHFHQLPKAIQKKEEMENMYESDSDFDDEEEESEIDLEQESDDDDDADYEEMEEPKSQQTHDLLDDDAEDEDWGAGLQEELYFTSPLDQFDVYLEFKKTFEELGQRSLPIYQQLTQSMTPEQQQFAQQLIVTAQERLNEQQQQQQ